VIEMAETTYENLVDDQGYLNDLTTRIPRTTPLGEGEEEEEVFQPTPRSPACEDGGEDGEEQLPLSIEEAIRYERYWNDADAIYAAVRKVISGKMVTRAGLLRYMAPLMGFQVSTKAMREAGREGHTFSWRKTSSLFYWILDKQRSGWVRNLDLGAKEGLDAGSEYYVEAGKAREACLDQTIVKEYEAAGLQFEPFFGLENGGHPYSEEKRRKKDKK
jgi:hypothetical protein